MRISFKHKGKFEKTAKFANKVSGGKYLDVLNNLAQIGVEALSAATPVDSGKTASSWSYEIERGAGSTKIIYSNSNVNQNVNIAIILQYGHGTGTGGYVAGRDYINPAMRPVFDQLAEAAWKEVTSS